MIRVLIRVIDQRRILKIIKTKLREIKECSLFYGVSSLLVWLFINSLIYCLNFVLFIL